MTRGTCHEETSFSQLTDAFLKVRGRVKGSRSFGCHLFREMSFPSLTDMYQPRAGALEDVLLCLATGFCVSLQFSGLNKVCLGVRDSLLAHKHAKWWSQTRNCTEEMILIMAVETSQ